MKPPIGNLIFDGLRRRWLASVAGRIEGSWSSKPEAISNLRRGAYRHYCQLTAEDRGLLGVIAMGEVAKATTLPEVRDIVARFKNEQRQLIHEPAEAVVNEALAAVDRETAKRKTT